VEDQVPKTVSIKSNIDNIFSSIIQYGTLRPSRFLVEFILPAKLDTGSLQELKTDSVRRLSLSCENVSLPGRGVSTTPNRIYGPVREMPHERLFSGDLDLTFRVGKDMFERRIFELWMDLIVNKYSNDFNYFNNYATEMTISQLNLQDEKVYQMRLFDAYPKTINPIGYEVATTDEYVRQSISMHFRKYEVDIIEGTTKDKWADKFKLKGTENLGGSPMDFRIPGNIDLPVDSIRLGNNLA